MGVAVALALSAVAGFALAARGTARKPRLSGSRARAEGTIPEKSAQALRNTLVQTKASPSPRLGLGLAKGLDIDAGAAM